MHVGSEHWRQVLIDGAKELAVSLSDDQLEQFEQFARLLLAWNRKTNLTTITEPKDIAVKHILDSIAAVPHLPERGRLLDIGTGGGFPGLPLKIMRPGYSMTLIDGSRKKISFVRHVIQQLSLDTVDAIHARAEDLAKQDEYKGRFDIVVSRAVADVKKLLELAVPLLAEKGSLFAYKGPRRETFESECIVKESPDRFTCTILSKRFFFQRLPFRLPMGDSERFLYVFRYM